MILLFTQMRQRIETSKIALYNTRSTEESYIICIVQYYYDPVSGRRFRSKKEVLHFLETGTPKKNATAENTVSDECLFGR